MDLSALDRERPVLIAGPTASGKSALALRIAERLGGVIVNADALQVYSNWRILSARPSDTDLARAAHHLYGHIAPTAPYSVGHWLREVAPLLEGNHRPIIVGGTGLYFSALTEGLAEIPATPQEIRADADSRDFMELAAELDERTKARIDTRNPARVRRAWEVLRATGRGLATWQDETPPPLLPLAQAQPLLAEAPPDWLTPRIERRFDAMLANGALDEARANLPDWSPARPSSRAIGAPELIAHLNGSLSRDQARQAAIIATRQFAKRQRTWFKSRLAAWQRVQPG